MGQVNYNFMNYIESLLHIHAPKVLTIAVKQDALKNMQHFLYICILLSPSLAATLCCGQTAAEQPRVASAA